MDWPLEIGFEHDHVAPWLRESPVTITPLVFEPFALSVPADQASQTLPAGSTETLGNAWSSPTPDAALLHGTGRSVQVNPPLLETATYASLNAVALGFEKLTNGWYAQNPAAPVGPGLVRARFRRSIA